MWSIQAPISNWPTATTEILKSLFYALTIIVPVLITAVVSWKISRQQLTMKTEELKAQGDLRARELLFNAYQKKIERIGNNASEVGEAFGQMIGQMEGKRDEEIAPALILTLKVTTDGFKSSIEELEHELSWSGLPASRQQDLVAIKQIFATDFDNLSVKEIGPIYVRLMAALGIIYSLQTELTNKKAEDLFKDQLPRPQRNRVSVREVEVQRGSGQEQ
jgi:hypothetical protein